MKKLSEGTRKIMGKEYRSFCECMIEAADNCMLPFNLKFDDANILTIKDIEEFCCQFEEDTELEMTGNFFVCPDCGKLHIYFTVDYVHEDDEDDYNYYLQ